MPTKASSPTKNKGKVFFVAKLSGPLLGRLPLNRSLSQPFCLVTQWEGVVRDKTKRLHGGPIPYELSRLL